MRDRHNGLGFGLIALAFAAALCVAVVNATDSISQRIASGQPRTTITGREPSIAVLGDGTSLSDVVSQTYGRTTPRNVQSAKLDNAKRSGLTKQTPMPPPSGLFGGLFNLPPAQVMPPMPVAIPRPAVAPRTFRTVCVKLCDGSFFPVSFSTTRDRFRSDEETCRSSCDAPTRLFVFETDGGSPETMEDVHGVSYMSLATAFKFRAMYDPACKCRAHPWEQEAFSRHQRYAEDESAGVSIAEPVRPPNSHAAAGNAPAQIGPATSAPPAGAAMPDPPATSTSPLPEGAPLETSSTTVLAIGVAVAPKVKTLKAAQWTEKRMSLGSTKVTAAKPELPTPRRRSASADDIFRASFGQ